MIWWRRLRLYIWRQGFDFWWPTPQDFAAQYDGTPDT